MYIYTYIHIYTYVHFPVQKRAVTEAEAQLSALDAEEASVSEEHRKEAARLEEGSAARSGASSRDHQLRELLKAKKSGAIPGIIGRLGSLGSIPVHILYVYRIHIYTHILIYISVSGASSRDHQLREPLKAKKSGAIPGIIGRFGSLGSIPVLICVSVFILYTYMYIYRYMCTYMYVYIHICMYIYGEKERRHPWNYRPFGLARFYLGTYTMYLGCIYVHIYLSIYQYRAQARATTSCASCSRRKRAARFQESLAD